MTELIYTYRRGVGWYTIPEGTYATMSCGTVVRLEIRKPYAGERYRRTSNTQYCVNGEPTEEWLDYVRDNEYRSQQTWGVFSRVEPGFLYMVTIPV